MQYQLFVNVTTVVVFTWLFSFTKKEKNADVVVTNIVCVVDWISVVHFTVRFFVRHSMHI